MSIHGRIYHCRLSVSTTCTVRWMMGDDGREVTNEEQEQRDLRVIVVVFSFIRRFGSKFLILVYLMPMFRR